VRRSTLFREANDEQALDKVLFGNAQVGNDANAEVKREGHLVVMHVFKILGENSLPPVKRGLEQARGGASSEGVDRSGTARADSITASYYAYMFCLFCVGWNYIVVISHLESLHLIFLFLAARVRSAKDNFETCN